MQTAIAEMRASRSEHHDRFDPLVGAVIIDRMGNELGRTHRASLREGDHAEFTLLERLLLSMDLEGSTLYVTLEPCTSRRPPKKPCAERIVATRVSKVYIGMPDPNPQIQGRGITYLFDHDVEVGFFDLDLYREIREANKDFIAQHEQAADASVDADAFHGPSDREKEPVPTAEIGDLSVETVQAYVAARDLKYDVPSPELWTFMLKNGFLTTIESVEKLIPTVAGLLLFGTRPEDFLVQSKVKAEARHGQETVAKDIGGPLISMPDDITRFLAANMTTYTRIDGFKRVEVPAYPLEALREAIVNAIVHRDYGGGMRVLVQVFGDRIVVKSPGHLIRPLSLKAVRSYNAAPYGRNPRIAETFSHMGLMEERGWGIPAMRDILLQHNLPPPRFDYEGGYFVVTFHGRRRVAAEAEVAPQILEQLTERQRNIVEMILKRRRITSSDCVTEFNVTRDTVNRDFSQLMSLGVIEKRGSGRGTYYVLLGSEAR
jgi:ATP-dependent DNA helicase RecG